MLKKFSVIAAAAVATVAVAACGTAEIDTTEAQAATAASLSATYEAYYAEQGISSADAGSSGITFTCPDTVPEGETFSCTIGGKNSGESVDVQMTFNDSTELVAVDQKAYDAAVVRVDEAETVALEAG
jgi:hypothetical protein